MSHSTYAVVSTASGSGAGSALAAAMSAAGGCVIAGAAVYMAARQMRSDYCRAMAEYEDRFLRETSLNHAENASFALAQQRARLLTLALDEKAAGDPNTAFLLGGLGRLKQKLGGEGPQGSGPNAGAALQARCEKMLAAVAAGEATAQFAEYESLNLAVSEHLAQLQSRSSHEGDKKAEMARLFAIEIEAFRDDLALSILAEDRFRKNREFLECRLEELAAVAPVQPSVSLQSLRLLRERFRGEIKRIAHESTAQRKNAIRVRELAGQISAQAQAVLRQSYFSGQHTKAEQILKRVSAEVAVSPVQVSVLERLADEARALFEDTERLLDEKAAAEYLQDQVGRVLGNLGYRVSEATNGEDQSRMVAVLESGLGVQFNIDGKGNLSGEMVAFSEGFAEVDAYAEEKVCDLMDAIFAGLRRGNHVVKERKRHHFKAGKHRVQVVSLREENSVTSVAVEQKAMQLPAGS